IPAMHDQSIGSSTHASLAFARATIGTERPANFEERTVEDVLQRTAHIPKICRGDEQVTVGLFNRGLIGFASSPRQSGNRADVDAFNIWMVRSPERGVEQLLNTVGWAVVN